MYHVVHVATSVGYKDHRVLWWIGVIGRLNRIDPWDFSLVISDATSYIMVHPCKSA